MGKLILPEKWSDPLCYGFHDDFIGTLNTDMWTLIAASTGTATVADGRKGIVPILTAATDNDDTYIEGDMEVFQFIANKPIEFEAYLQFTEANTDDANVIVGLVNAVAANLLIDDGAGVAASSDGAVFYKVDGGTVWNTCTMNGANRTATETAVTAGGSSYQKFRIEVWPISTLAAQVKYWIDDVLVATDEVLLASATEMQVVVGAKAGGANVETINVDYVRCRQLR